VFEAVEALDVMPPASQARSWNWLPPATHAPVEEELDTALAEELGDRTLSNRTAESDRQRVLRQWRSGMLLRQVGLGLARVALEEAIRGWLDEHKAALQNTSAPGKLQEGLRNLVFATGSERVMYLAPFRPRTERLGQELPANVFLAGLNSARLTLSLEAHGDALLARLHLQQRADQRLLAKFPVDLAIAREALLHAEGSGSFTEIGPSAFARIERSRAALLGRGTLRDVEPSFTDSAGTVFSLVPGDGGELPLRANMTSR
jgi:hypothetical protein